MKPKNSPAKELLVTKSERHLRNGHKGAVLWLTGLSGAGKSTLSLALEKELFDVGFHVYVLDGDHLRRGLNANLGFSPEDRAENVRRVAQLAGLMVDAGLVVIAALISPYREDRNRAREIALEAGDFIEIFVDTPLSICEQRDTKGLYARARKGEIADFTGVSAPYEAPLHPEITIHTGDRTVAESVAEIVEFLLPRLRI
jgi:adenylylsulfate kinase